MAGEESPPESIKKNKRTQGKQISLWCTMGPVILQSHFPHSPPVWRAEESHNRAE